MMLIIHTLAAMLLLAYAFPLALTGNMKDSHSHGASKKPYQILGTYLKSVREQHNESLAEVSGAVEIDLEMLERIENGHERPSEDILMLLINHFDVQDQDAVQLWESAGYDNTDTTQLRRQLEGLEKTAVVVLAMDVRTVYSDGLSVDANQNGIVLNFTQAGTGKGSQNTISRVGMSYDQAMQVIDSLQKAVLYGRHGSAQRQLPPTFGNRKQDIS